MAQGIHTAAWLTDEHLEALGVITAGVIEPALRNAEGALWDDLTDSIDPQAADGLGREGRRALAAELAERAAQIQLLLDLQDEAGGELWARLAREPER